MSIPIGFDTVEEIANLALFTRAKEKKAFDRGIIRQKNSVTLSRVNKDGIGYFELSSNTALLRKVANIAETAKKYPALTPLVRRKASQTAEEIRKLYLKGIGGPEYTPKTLTELDGGGWGNLPDKGFLRSGDNMSVLIHTRGAAAEMERNQYGSLVRYVSP
jgi:hypothetical protein